ncbi:Serine/threonine exchanger SteT [Caloramator mitchellensis]|uniref:Serine/threonine exchanger SteT n=1 Tax=Caloramator mitchellensis TaxID=908809 RepID=A0A0R3JUW1_CALMK|nr:amino acid permease [Caloramator mitchellensis]KRQ87351.1 Serine/threonine exchanger SteT [Caloramator mitchellensis]
MEARKLEYVEEKKELKKELGLLEAIAIVIGVVIGSGIFFKPAIVAKNAGAPGLGILAWVVGGVITIAAGLTVAEIAAAIPKTGGLYAYLKELYGDFWAYLLGWVQITVYFPGSLAALAIIFATQATTFIPMTEMQQKLLAIFILFFLAAANVISTKFGGKIQTVATIGKLVPIFVIAIFGLIKGTAHGFTPMVSSTSTAGGFGLAILGTLWAYDGWINVGNIAGELKNPAKDLPKAIILGLGLVLVAYLSVNLAVLNVLPFDQVVASKKAASDAAVVMFGNFGASFISLGILVSIFGALNGYILTASRVPYAMAEEGLLPFKGFFSKLNEKSGTPINSIIYLFVVGVVYIMTGSFDTLTDLVVFVLWIFFTMAVAGVFILRKKFKHLKRPYTVPLYPIVPIIGIAGGIFILFSTITASPSRALLGIGVTVIGAPIYMYIRKNK